jgi:outer membrane protein assembly factor BamB
MAFDRQGRRRWHFPTDSGIKNNVAVANGRVFATSIVGTLYALDEATGKLVWQAGLERERARWENTATVVHDGIVHVGSTAHVAAFETETGKKLWESRVPKSSDWSPHAYPIPTVARGKVLLFHLRFGAAALDQQTGTLAWQLEGGFNGVAFDGSETLYTVRNNSLASIAVDTGRIVWAGSDKITSSASKPILTSEGVVIGTADGRVCLVSTENGRILWSTQTGPSLTSLQPYQRGGSDVNSSPTVHHGKVYVGASDGKLHVLSLADGKSIATHQLGVPIASSPLIADDTLYVGGYDGNVYAFAVGGRQALTQSRLPDE